MRLAVPCALSLALAASPAVAEEKPAPAPARPAPAKKKKAEPLATAEFPAFEMIKGEGGGSRLVVYLSKRVEVGEQASSGTLTYVLHDARVDTYNDTNPLELFYFDTPALRARMRSVKKDVVLTVALRADVKATTRMVDTKHGVRFEVQFPAGSYAEKPAPPAPKVEKKK
ncbi:MAG: hypothetical protein IT374_02210 [Polyangiaceae bacterium]|nr:hypothetical protein [Polyangiaceae bacterium]